MNAIGLISAHKSGSIRMLINEFDMHVREDTNIPAVKAEDLCKITQGIRYDLRDMQDSSLPSDYDFEHPFEYKSALRTLHSDIRRNAGIDAHASAKLTYLVEMLQAAVWACA